MLHGLAHETWVPRNDKTNVIYSPDAPVCQ